VTSIGELFAPTDKIQAEFAMFESIPGLRNWLHHVEIMGAWVPDVGENIRVQAGPSWSCYGSEKRIINLLNFS
jgi:hypothetical protein